MNQIIKVLLLVFVVLYVVSPVDAFPGPIDDLIVILISIAAQGKTRLPES